jgi:predicted MFS family arabinose efflux permease
VFVTDPLMIFERRLVGIERKIDYTCRGVEKSSRLMDGLRWDGSLKQDNFVGFALAIVMFSLATSIFFTPLPIFLKQGLQLPTSMVYIAYILVSIGATAGYFLMGRKARSMDIRKQMPRFVLFRSIMVFLFVVVIMFAFSPTFLTGVLLVFIGFAFGMYYIMMLALSMEVIPEGKSGFFDGLVGVGAAVGSFLGPFLADNLNYLPTFLIAGVVFLFAFITLKIVK